MCKKSATLSFHAVIEQKQVIQSSARRTLWHGAARLYGCWIDEGLNKVLRDISSRVHRSHMEVRIFGCFQLQGSLGLSLHLYGDASVLEE